MSPLKVLGRGYSITEDHMGRAVVSADGLQPGDHVTIRFHQGKAMALIEKVLEDKL